MDTMYAQMSRESAIKFLRDISMGIDYLETAYSSNRQGEYYDDNAPRVIFLHFLLASINHKIYSYRSQATGFLSFEFLLYAQQQQNYVRRSPPTTTTTTTTTTTEKPIVLVEKSLNAAFRDISSPLMQLNEIPNDKFKGSSSTQNRNRAIIFPRQKCITHKLPLLFGFFSNNRFNEPIR